MIELLPKNAVKQLQKSLSEKRYIHSVGVMETAFLLADSWINHPVDRVLLAWASLFHDCGKEISKEKRKKFSENGRAIFGRELLDNTKLNHAPFGAWILHKQYEITSKDVLMAVAYHPSGHRDLTPIGWMVYIADFLEPGRTYLSNREEVLERSCSDPLTGLREVTQLRIDSILIKGKPILPITQQFHEYLSSVSSI